VSNWLDEGAVGRDWFGLDLFRPGPRFLRDGGCLFLLDEVGSTNDFLRGRGPAAVGRRCLWDGWGWKGLDRQTLRPPADPSPGTVVVARRQTAGKGRQGRDWRDCGGLNLSVVVPPHRATFDQGFSVWLGLITAVVLREVFQLGARLKWPNDIVVGRRKLGGILLENVGRDDRRRVVAGLGLNLGTRPADFPPDLQGRATSVRIEAGREMMPGEVAGRIIHRVEDELDRFRADGWRPYREVLVTMDSLLGRRVRVHRGAGQVNGRVEGIGEHGELLLRTDGGELRTLPAGDVHLETHPREGLVGKEDRRAGADR
jgi:BirA family biotin operon repressor/biotin-[acetyl-CoA-carboxylase] ligase